VLNLKPEGLPVATTSCPTTPFAFAQTSQSPHSKSGFRSLPVPQPRLWRLRVLHATLLDFRPFTATACTTARLTAQRRTRPNSALW